jgi:hypothetical protein
MAGPIGSFATLAWRGSNTGPSLHHATTINVRGNSYRLKEKLKVGLIRTEEPVAIG